MYVVITLSSHLSYTSGRRENSFSLVSTKLLIPLLIVRHGVCFFFISGYDVVLHFHYVLDVFRGNSTFFFFLSPMYNDKKKAVDGIVNLKL